MRYSAACTALVIVAALGCAPPPLPPPPPRRPPAQAVVSAECERAATLLREAGELRDRGRLLRGLDLIESAALLCPARAAEAWSCALPALEELGDAARLENLAVRIRATSGAADAVPAASPSVAEDAASPESLLAEARSAAARGDDATAHRLFDRALVKLERTWGPARVELAPLVGWWSSGAPVLATCQRSRVLAIAGAAQIDLVDLEGDEAFASLPTPEGPRRFAFSPDGAMLAVGTPSGTQLWSVAGLRTPAPDRAPMPALLPAERGELHGWSPRGNLLLRDALGLVMVSPTDSKEIERWNGAVDALLLSPDESVVATKRTDAWFLGKRGDTKPPRKVDGWLEAFSPDGRSAFVTRGGQLVRETLTGQGRPVGVSISGATDWAPDGSRLAHLAGDTVELYEVGAAVKRVGAVSQRAFRGHFAADGRVVLGVEGGIVRVSRAFEATAMVRRALPVRGVAFVALPAPGIALAHDRRVSLGNGEGLRSVDWEAPVDYLRSSQEGAVLAMATARGDLGLWQSGEVYRWPEPEGTLRDVQLGDGALWTLAVDGSLTRWSTATRQATLRWLPKPKVEALLPHGDALLLAHRNLGLLLAPDAREPAAVLDGHAEGVTRFAIGRGVVATGSADDTVRLWDDKPGSPQGRLLVGHYGDVTELAFLLGGTVLASGGKDGLVWLWSSGGEQIRTVADERSPVAGLAASAGGTHLAIARQTGPVSIWKVAGATKGSSQIERVGWLHVLDGAWVFVTPSGHVSLAGDRSREPGLVRCRLGVAVLPFDVCEGALSDSGLLTAALR